MPSLFQTLLTDNTRLSTAPQNTSFIYQLQYPNPSAVLSCWLDTLLRDAAPVARLKADWMVEWRQTLVGMWKVVSERARLYWKLQN